MSFLSKIGNTFLDALTGAMVGSGKVLYGISDSIIGFRGLFGVKAVSEGLPVPVLNAWVSSYKTLTGKYGQEEFETFSKFFNKLIGGLLGKDEVRTYGDLATHQNVRKFSEVLINDRERAASMIKGLLGEGEEVAANTKRLFEYIDYLESQGFDSSTIRLLALYGNLGEVPPKEVLKSALPSVGEHIMGTTGRMVNVGATIASSDRAIGLSHGVTSAALYGTMMGVQPIGTAIGSVGVLGTMAFLGPSAFRDLRSISTGRLAFGAYTQRIMHSGLDRLHERDETDGLGLAVHDLQAGRRGM